LLPVKSKDLKEIDLQYFVETHQKRKYATLVVANFDTKVLSLM
jgi:hypothetical protein